MTKNTKLVIGVGVLAVAGYYIWKQTQDKKNVVGRTKIIGAGQNPFQVGRPVRPVRPNTPQFMEVPECRKAINCTSVNIDGVSRKIYTCAGLDPKTRKHNMSLAAKNAGDFAGTC